MKVSVIVATWNSSWCIVRALESAFAQTLPPHEVIVCDDGSTDGTPDLVEQRFGSKVQVLRLPHRNASASRRDGFERATGDWVAFLDSDDYWAPEKLERQAAFVASHPGMGWIATDGSYVSEAGVIRESWLADYFDPVRELAGDLLPAMVERCFPLTSSVLVRADVYREVGGIDPDLVYNHDYDLWLKVLARHPGAQLTDRLVYYWASPNALSQRYEGRHRDNLATMRRIESGAYTPRPEIRRQAAERAAVLEFHLAVIDLRAGHTARAREHFRRAVTRGPLHRRLIAAAGNLAPAWLLPFLARASWLRRAVSESREPARPIAAGARGE